MVVTYGAKRCGDWTSIASLDGRITVAYTTITLTAPRIRHFDAYTIHGFLELYVRAPEKEDNLSMS